MKASEIIRECKEFAKEKGINLDNWSPIAKKHDFEWWDGENCVYFEEFKCKGGITIKLKNGDSTQYYYKHLYVKLC